MDQNPKLLHRRVRAAGIRTRIGNHTFQATGSTVYLKNDGTLEKAAMRCARPSSTAAATTR